MGQAFSFVKRDGWMHERIPTGKLKVQKLVDGAWVTTAHADDIDACRRHAGAVGGSVRAVDRKGVVVAAFGVVE